MVVSALISEFSSLCEGLGLSSSKLLMILALLITAGYSAAKLISKPKKLIPVPPEKANNKNRKYGHWTPEIFELPEPEEYKDWSITETRPVPYRAFKHTYYITMGIRAMEWDKWIELDNEWPKYHNRKLQRIKEKGAELYGTLPEAYPAAMELLAEFKRFLPARYPKLFKRTEVGIDNLVTGESFDFTEPLKEDPMLMAAKMTQDDLAIMIENENGEYVLKGGAIMLAGFWRLRDKINLPLSAIHTTGDVPKYNEKLKSGMEKFFIRQTPEKPIVRNNYFLQTDDDLAWSKSIGDEDNEVVGWYTATPASDINKVYFRSERQSLRRLPITGATIFTIRTYFLPVVELCKEPYVPRRLLNGILSWTDVVQEYRGYTKFKDVLLPYLEERAEEQEAMGYTNDTEPDTYPM
ncbi:unnamed protein product [Kuraishia capsulata CBS 1993]|uniref:HRQ family protein 1 n=1 Tax=Kuraishia capsulata CBS 1993 TaxID=1382522 RepID=W6MN99_9ASCO|nr:uncharacterized protein KUCA_T00004062001 [Kuraishia capsulata CBS 1993]CDK28081.1 unnamed protein product [Kuraishia capsulata CBS 1993]